MTTPGRVSRGKGNSSGNPYQHKDGLWRPDKERRYSACLSVIGKFRSAGRQGSSEYGFTLIELLIVIIVLGILAAIVIFSLTGVTGQSKPAACTSDAKTVEIGRVAYHAENNDTFRQPWPP